MRKAPFNEMEPNMLYRSAAAYALSQIDRERAFNELTSRFEAAEGPEKRIIWRALWIVDSRRAKNIPPPN